MLGEPAITAYDLRFRLLNIPVRIHPLFWLVMVLLAGGSLRIILIFTACALVSILVHEFGHGLMARACGCSPWIVLYGMGGLCFSEAERQSFGQRLAVLICGPGAGFVLAGLTLLTGLVAFHIQPLDSIALLGLGPGNMARAAAHLVRAGGWTLVEIYRLMLWINLGWGIVNLFPIWPLDGGQILGVILTKFNRRNGMRYAHVVSLIAAGLLAAWMFKQSQVFMALWFAFFAMTNFQVLQMLHATTKYSGTFEDDADWWKR